MSGPLTPPLKPDCGSYPADPNFPVSCDVDYTQAYCCMNEESTSGGGFVNCQPAVDICMVGPPGCHMAFPTNNDEGQPMLKTALNGTTMAAWAKIGFQGYCSTFENADDTAETIVTMGNVSQPFNDEQCMATITAFQYGWGTVNQGNRCRVTILDQKGSTFQQWVQRMGINPEGDSTPIQGKYRMKVQFGWYTTGGGDGDVCGQAATPIMPVNSGGILPIATPAAGLNSAYIICSPVMYFITDWINVHYEDGKFIYELEGVDLLVRGQENMIQKTLGSDLNGMYFTKAVQLLGQMSFPPFRVEFKCIDATSAVVDMQFAIRDGIAGASDRQCKSASDCAFYDGDCQGYGPFGKWKAYTKPPIAVIQQWIKDNNVCALDLTGLATSNRSRVGITMNYDPIYKFIPGVTSDDFCQTECSANLPNYGRLILWAGNGIPYGQGNFSDSQMNQRMKAVYLVNGGNCSPVLHFAPSFRWHSMAAQKAAGSASPRSGRMDNQIAGAVKTLLAIVPSTGPFKILSAVATNIIMKISDPVRSTMETTYHSVMSNLAIGAIEADLRVQGDPSDWLCSPAQGYGKCVGIVFINPFFLFDGGGDCPVWSAGVPGDQNFAGICNELLTSKGWFIMGADHQIKDGQYITTLKLKLIAPGAELNPATNPPTNLGGWSYASATPLPYGGQFGCLNKTLVGNTGTGWGNADPGTCGASWVGGGTACSPNYDSSADLPPD